jgi:hypothetical protein
MTYDSGAAGVVAGSGTEIGGIETECGEGCGGVIVIGAADNCTIECFCGGGIGGGAGEFGVSGGWVSECEGCEGLETRVCGESECRQDIERIRAYSTDEFIGGFDC